MSLTSFFGSSASVFAARSIPTLERSSDTPLSASASEDTPMSLRRLSTSSPEAKTSSEAGWSGNTWKSLPGLREGGAAGAVRAAGTVFAAWSACLTDSLPRAVAAPLCAGSLSTTAS